MDTISEKVFQLIEHSTNPNTVKLLKRSTCEVRGHVWNYDRHVYGATAVHSGCVRCGAHLEYPKKPSESGI